MRVLLAGGSGAIGLPLVRRLVAGGHEVTAIHRGASGHDRLQAEGATPVRADVLDRATLLEKLAGHRCDAVISQLTALKKPPTRHADMAATNRLRTEGTANLLAVAEQARAERFVTQSMFFGYGYGDFGDRLLTEHDQFAPTGHGGFEQALSAMRSDERQVFGASEMQGIALRYGLFYGPEAAGDALVRALHKRRLPVISRGGVLPLIHVDDAAHATVLALERGAAGAAYNIADDEPVSFSDFVTALAAAIGAPRPMSVPSWLLTATPYLKAMMVGGMRVSSARARDELGWRPKFPSYREGISSMAEHYRAGVAA